MPKDTQTALQLQLAPAGADGRRTDEMRATHMTRPWPLLGPRFLGT